MTPWCNWLAYAQRVLGVSPASFWALSLREWRALMGAAAFAPLTRDEFSALSGKFPD